MSNDEDHMRAMRRVDQMGRDLETTVTRGHLAVPLPVTKEQIDRLAERRSGGVVFHDVKVHKGATLTACFYVEKFSQIGLMFLAVLREQTGDVVKMATDTISRCFIVAPGQNELTIPKGRRIKVRGMVHVNDIPVVIYEMDDPDDVEVLYGSGN